MNKIVSKEHFSENVVKLEIEAPLIAKSRRAGHFVIVRVGEKGERIPLTIAGSDLEKGTITLVVQKIGVSSTKLCALNVGDEVTDVVGPLGKATHIENFGTVVCACGGVGTAPVYPQVKWLHERGVAVDVIIGAKTKDLVIYKEEMEAVCDNLYICTDDGSEGFKGLVTAMLEKLVNEDGKIYDQAVAIGPMIMMKFATLTCKKLNLPVIVSLNTLMVDGTGMCGACRVTVGGKVRFACVEGPEFDGYLVDFDEAMRRQRMYVEEEHDATEHHVCRIGRGK